jgi:RNA ligase (TIGR02306 family)
MSTVKAEIVKINSLEKTPGSDRLTNFGILGWSVISSNINQTDEYFGDPRYQIGDQVVYIPIDSIITKKLEDYLFEPDAKIRPKEGRITTLRLRGAISQGMIVDINDTLEEMYPGIKKKKEGDDVTEMLGITKFEPPPPPEHMSGEEVRKSNPKFFRYTDMDNIKRHHNLFQEGEEVQVTSKLHGTAHRAAILRPKTTTLFEKIKSFCIAEYCVGSKNVQYSGGAVNFPWFNKLLIKLRLKKTDYYSQNTGDNVYVRTAAKYNLRSKLKPGEILFSELVGSKIQKNYTYGCKDGEHKLYAYDVMIDGRFLDFEEFRAWCEEREITPVPLLYKGPYSKEKIEELTIAKNPLGKEVQEGVVVKPVKEKTTAVGRKILKSINPSYLLKDNSEYH